VLVVSPHFPPDASAGAHRARVLAPHLETVGWRPTVLTVDPGAYEGTLDYELAAMVPDTVEVIRTPAWRAGTTRPFGFGDLGLRSLPGLWRTARRLVAARDFDAIFITTYPVYPALIGPQLRTRASARLVVDLQDPWVGEWGLTVGPNGGPDLRSKLSRRVLSSVEHKVLPACDALTSVSSELLSQLRDKHPVLADRPLLTLPIGLDSQDLAWVRQHPKPIAAFDPDDGNFHVCCVGTLLPLAFEPLRAVFEGARQLRVAHANLATRLRLHFIGTSNQSDAAGPLRVAPIAEAFGVADLVTEQPERIPFADAVRVQLAASALLLLGSTERRYVASKLAPSLAAERPLLVVAHESSAMVAHVRHAADSAVRVLTFAEHAEEVAGPVRSTLEQWLRCRPSAPDTSSLMAGLTGPALARQLAGLLDAIVDARD
jgi:hypothetical protein